MSLPMMLSYRLPDKMFLKRGDIVLVPMGSRKIHGVVWQGEPKGVPESRLKKIIERVESPGISDELIEFVDWVANYTLSSPGNVLRMVIGVKKAFEKERKTPYYRLADYSNVRVTKERQKVIEFLSSSSVKTIHNIVKDTGVGRSVVKKMIQLGAVEEVELKGNISESEKVDAFIVPKLSESQQKVANKLCKYVENDCFSVTLLDGVTGSGKTEVYLSAVARAIEENETQALVMLPEIILTTQFIHRFKERFGFNPTEWHSGLTQSRRALNWRRIQSGKARIIIGARSALFLPYKKLRLIVVDEEHDASYKQEEGVVYQARDMAVKRASIEKTPVILISATPSIETIKNAKDGKYNYLKLTSRYGGAKLPNVSVVDMRKESSQGKFWLSGVLRDRLVKNFEDGMQSLLFLNRRGYAPLTLCRKCGYRFQCSKCSSWLVRHRDPDRLQCHHCGHRQPVTKSCPQCGAENALVACGPGVQRIAEEVNKYLPEAEIAIMTSDNLSDKEGVAQVINQVVSGKKDIIIGTQVVAKGHHFPKLSLVGVVDADLGLAGGDMRAAERTYQLLHQVSGRAGREKYEGSVILQSYMPQNDVIKALASGERDKFIDHELLSRERMSMPPFAKLAAIIVSGENINKTLKIAKQLAISGSGAKNIEVLGPVEAPLFLLRGKYRFRLLVKSTKNINIQKWIRNWLTGIEVDRHHKIKVDIDPYNFM